jgi:predicted kinase
LLARPDSLKKRTSDLDLEKRWHGRICYDDRMQRLIIIRGYPGSGKTTLGKLLEGRHYGAFIDHNQILTFIAGITGDDEGIYDEIHALERVMCRKLLKNGSSVIVARGFSSATSVQAYAAIAEQASVPCDILRLNVPPQVLAQRVVAPERRTDYNPTLTPAALTSWVERNPLESIEFEHSIDGSESIETVAATVESILSAQSPK